MADSFAAHKRGRERPNEKMELQSDGDEGVGMVSNGATISWMKMKVGEELLVGVPVVRSAICSHSREGATMKSKKEKAMERTRIVSLSERWSSGLERALSEWSGNVRHALSFGIARMAEAGMQESRYGHAVLLANLSNAIPGRGGGGGSGLLLKNESDGTTAYDTLHRHFQELDQKGTGFISEADLKEALKRLNLPASENDVQTFMDHMVDMSQTAKITFEHFADYAIDREHQLLDTFHELDKGQNGYISEYDMKAALRKYKFSLSDEEISRKIRELRLKSGTHFYNRKKSYDFPEYRDFLMYSTTKEFQDSLEIWEAAAMDLGDGDASFPTPAETVYTRGKHGERRSKRKIVKHLIVSGMSSAVSRSLVSPFERVKVLVMVNKNLADAGYLSMFSKVVRVEGTFGLFKGNALSIIRIAPKKAVEYLMYEKCSDAIARSTGRIDISGRERLLLGSIASMAGVFATFPLDTLRASVMGEIGPQGVVDVTRAILQREGWPGLFKGLGPSMVRVAPYGAIKFLVYDRLRQWYRERIGHGRKMGAIPTMIFEALAGASAQTVVYPLEMVQRRLQVQASKQGPILYDNMIQAFQVILREEGAGAVYAGLVPNLMKLLPAAAISFLAYEAFKNQMA